VDSAAESEIGSPDDSPAPPPEAPVITYGLLVLITAIFVAMLIAGHGDVSTVALQFGAKQNALIRAGQYWRLVTPIFLHGNWVHLLVNGFSLLRLGAPMEQIYGRKKYLALFLFAGITGNVLSFELSPLPSVGASGALFGLVGAGLVFPIRFRDLVPAEARKSIVTQLAFVAAINLALGFKLNGIVDNWAHIGGLIGGAFLALFLMPDVLDSEWKSIGSKVGLNALVAAFVGLVVVSWFYQWRWSALNPPHQSVQMIAYYPEAEPPWWCIRLPAQWRFSKGVWRVMDGPSIKVADPLIGEPAGRRDLQMIIARRMPVNAELDGRPGWYTATPTRVQYRVPIYDRMFELTLDGDGKPLKPNVIGDFAIAASSVRFIRPPYNPPTFTKP